MQDLFTLLIILSGIFTYLIFKKPSTIAKNKSPESIKRLKKWAILCLVGSFLAFSGTEDTKPQNRPANEASVPQTKQEQSTPPLPSSPTTIQEIKGKYMDYEYSVLFEADDDQYVITYTPFLPRNDEIVIGAMLDSITVIYGKHLVTNLTPKIIEKEGVNIIQFAGVNANYNCLPVKEDTGEIYSIYIWSEAL